MASNLDYLDPALLPLEEKVKAYLKAEEKLRNASAAPAATPDAAGTAEVASLHQEILDLLPTRNEWVMVNLGYGPSRVGAWHVPATNDRAEHWQVRVIQ